MRPIRLPKGEKKTRGDFWQTSPEKNLSKFANSAAACQILTKELRGGKKGGGKAHTGKRQIDKPQGIHIPNTSKGTRKKEKSTGRKGKNSL